MAITITTEKIECIFSKFERCLNKYNRSKKELLDYPNSELSQVSMDLSYGKCNAIYECISVLGLANEFFKWCDTRNLDYYEVLNFVKTNHI